MNIRQKRKAFKKRFGFNVPRKTNIRTAIQLMEAREQIFTIFKKLEAAILHLWELVKQGISKLAEPLKELFHICSNPYTEKTHKQYVTSGYFEKKLLFDKRKWRRD